MTQAQVWPVARVRAISVPPVLVAASVTLVALALGLWHIGAKSLWRDEITTATAARGDLLPMLGSMWSHDANGIAYYAIENVWGHAFGFGEGMLRLPSAICASLAIGAFYLFARRYVPGWAAAFGALILATSQMFVLYAQEARPYGLVLLLAVLLTWTAVRRDWRLYVPLAILLVYVNLWMWTLLGAHALGLLVARRLDRRAILALAIVAIGVAPIGLFAATHTSMTAWVPPLSPERIADVGLDLAGGSWLLLILALEAVGAGVWLAWRRRELWMLVAWAVVPVVLTLAVSLIHSMLVDRYLLVVLPPVVLLLAIAASRLPRLGIAVLGVTLAVSLSTGLVAYNAPKEDYRGAVATVLESAKPGDVLVLLPIGEESGLDYYAWRFDRPLPAFATVEQVEGSRPAGVWMVRRNDAAMAKEQARLGALGYRQTSTRRVWGFTLVRYALSIAPSK